MKILMVSMRSLHFTRWVNQLEGAGHEVYWFDIRDGGFPLGNLPWLNQIFGWKNRFQYPGYYYIKNKIPFLFRFLQFFNERSVDDEFDKVIKQIKPDAVHSFALYVSCTPILKVMEKNKHIPWIYSSWGSDLFYFQNDPNFLKDIKTVLPRVNYMFSDCQRDYHIAQEYGFQGDFLGVFPGGGGFNYSKTDKFIKPVCKRKIILLKGYQGRSGRAIQVMQAMSLIIDELQNYEIVVFGADIPVINYINKNKLSKAIRIKYLAKTEFLPHEYILELMGKALIYIGNSNSDGMPNTLLEAIIMGAFPIQSNPGGASEEVMEAEVNGLLIQNCDDVTEIQNHILTAISNYSLLEKAFRNNQTIIKPQFEREIIKSQVVDAYNDIL